ncbi:MAG: aryl-sulfate sulfotransferase [Myxococcota bacterium]
MRLPITRDGGHSLYARGGGTFFTMMALVFVSLTPTLSAETCPTQYPDRDQDGFGDPDPRSLVSACSSLAGYVSNGNDCNDLSAQVYPGASNAFWQDTLGSSDCTLQEPYSGLLLTVGCPTSTESCTLNGGCAFSSIQKAIDAAPENATIEVCQGVYSERLDFSGKAVTVRGRLTHLVILSGDGTPEPAVTFASGEDSDTRLQRMTISPMVRGGVGGGVYIENASPELEELTFQGNTLNEEGGALVIKALNGAKSSPVVRRSSFLFNHPLDAESGAGGAVDLLAQGTGSVLTPLFEDVRFADNSALMGGAVHGLAREGATLTLSMTRAHFFRNVGLEAGSAIALEAIKASARLALTSVLVEKNQVAGEALYLYVQDGSLPVSLENLTLVGNDAYRGVIFGAAASKGKLDLTASNSIFAFNNAIDAVARLVSYGRDGVATGRVSYVDVYANGFVGSWWSPAVQSSNVTTFDPRFKAFVYDEVTPSDLTLQPGSPAINAGNPTITYNDPSGSRNDLGAYGGPTGRWPAAAPTLLALENVMPDPEAMVLSRAVSFELLTAQSGTVTCLELLPWMPEEAPLESSDEVVEPGDEAPLDNAEPFVMPTRYGEALTFTTASLREGSLDLLGFKAESVYQCYFVTASEGGLAGNAFELTVPPLPFDLQGLWSVATHQEGAKPGYTLFNVFPPSFNPMYAVMVDMEGEVRWYLQMYNEGMGYSDEAYTADTAVFYRPTENMVVFGGGESLDALPQAHPVEPSQPSVTYSLACASNQDEIHRTCAGIPGSTLLPDTPNHDTIMSDNGKKLTYICSETLPQPGTTPDQYCVDPNARMEGFSVEEWDVSDPAKPVNTWRFSSAEQVKKCTLPQLAGELDPYHANAVWSSVDGEGREALYVSLRHRNHVLKIDRQTGTIVYKLGPLMEADRCPAREHLNPESCPGFDAEAEACSGPEFQPFTLQEDKQDTTCPSVEGYAGLAENHPQWFYGQHAPWIEQQGNGAFMMYLHDNGRNSPDNIASPESRLYSRALRMKVDERAKVAAVDWQYCRGTTPTTSDVWYAPAWGSFYPVTEVSGARTQNSLIASSHCIICSKYDENTSENTFISEVNEQKQVVWSLDLGQVMGVYRAERIPGCTRLPGRKDFLFGTGRLCEG